MFGSEPRLKSSSTLLKEIGVVRAKKDYIQDKFRYLEEKLIMSKIVM
jgi:hypothetical protein